MIQAVKDMGPYIVLMPGFALAHFEPCAEVRNTSVSLITLNKPVEFGSVNDPVNVVMCLACTDKSSHISLLSQIAEKLLTEGYLERLARCTDRWQLYQIINV